MENKRDRTSCLTFVHKGRRQKEKRVRGKSNFKEKHNRFFRSGGNCYALLVSIVFSILGGP